MSKLFCNNLCCESISEEGFCLKEFIILDDVKDTINGAFSTFAGKCRFFKMKGESNDVLKL